jgi:L-gulonolactone oxidase
MPAPPDALPSGAMDAVWQNWARNQRCAPTRIERPESEEQLVRAVRDAVAAGERVKVAGAGHSFTAIALTDGRLIKLDRYQRLLSADRESGLVTVQAGIPLWKLNRDLDALGLALPNLGDIAYQSVAGAIATATHGTGIRIGGLATQVAALRIIAGDGSIIDCSPDREPQVFRTARVGLGALGVVSTVTLRTVPAFNLHAVEAAARVDELLEHLDRHVHDNDHFEFFWIPHTGWAITKWNNRTAAPAEPRARWREFRDDILLSNVAFGALCRIGRLRPSLIPRLSRMIPSSGRVEYIDRSHRVFASPRMVRFYEMEYAIPAVHAAEALNRVREFVRRSGLMISFPVEVRFTAADDIPLSTASGRESCYIAVHVYRGMPYQQYFEAVEDIMDDYGGRPHWGKLHFQTAETLAPRYPQWEEFQSLRRRLDPNGTFTNPYLDRVLGALPQSDGALAAAATAAEG